MNSELNELVSCINNTFAEVSKDMNVVFKTTDILGKNVKKLNKKTRRNSFMILVLGAGLTYSALYFKAKIDEICDKIDDINNYVDSFCDVFDANLNDVHVNLGNVDDLK